MIRRPTAVCRRSKGGFTILELVIAMAMLLVISGAIFLLLEDAQFKLMGELNMVPVLQESRLAMDLIVRDIHRAGFPSPYLFVSDPAIATPAVQQLFSVGFVGLPTQSCVVNGTCTVPNGFDLLMESNPNPANNTRVQWIEYLLVRPAGASTSKLLRRQVDKDPVAGPAGAPANWVPVLENVLNDPNDPADAIFTYPCTGGTCPTADHLQQVQINLRIRSYQIDMQTHQYRQLSVVEVASRMNPIP